MKSLEELSKELSELQAKQSVLKESLDRIQAEIEAKKLEKCFLQYGVKIGSVVLSRSTLFLVKRINIYFGEPFLYGSKKNKNGAWSKKEQFIALWVVKND